METISVVITTWNEEKVIKRCLSSVQWADETILVDGNSADATVSIAKSFTKKIFSRPNDPMLNINKNFGFSKASGDWILSLDADEEIPSELAKEIRAVLEGKYEESGEIINGYWIARRNIIFGKWIRHGLWWPDKQLRLFRKGKGEFPCKHVHEYIKVDGKTSELIEPYIHYNYETISQYLRKLDTLYTENEVRNLAPTYQFSWHDAIHFPMSDFVKIYFAQGGYKDGLHGLVLSILQAFYSFIVFAKLWQLRKFSEEDISLSEVSRELVRSKNDVSYWLYEAKIRESSSPLKKLLFKFQRKIQIRPHSFII